MSSAHCHSNSTPHRLRIFTRQRVAGECCWGKSPRIPSPRKMLAAWTLRRNGTNLQSLRSISAPTPALGVGNTIATCLRLRTRRFATMEAATRLARLGSDLTAATGPSLGSTKAPALAAAWRCLVGCQSHVPALPVRPHDARARAQFLVASVVSTVEAQVVKALAHGER
jgi:hypothetical protein